MQQPGECSRFISSQEEYGRVVVAVFDNNLHAYIELPGYRLHYYLVGTVGYLHSSSTIHNNQYGVTA